MKSNGMRALAVAPWLLCAGSAWAATETGTAGFGVWTMVFLAFGAMIVALQAVPAAVLLGSLLRSLFGRTAVGAGTAGEGRKGA